MTTPDPSVPQAALTSEEWDAILEDPSSLTGGYTLDYDVRDQHSAFVKTRCHSNLTKHGAAAACLFGTTNGFTHEDVELLRVVADWMATGSYDTPTADVMRLVNEPERGLRSISLRIKALLPPPSPSKP